MKSFCLLGGVVVIVCLLVFSLSSWAKSTEGNAKAGASVTATIQPAVATPQLLGAEFTVEITVSDVQ